MFGQPVKLPTPSKGEDARAFAARERAALDRRLSNDASFYGDVEKNFSK